MPTPFAKRFAAMVALGVLLAIPASASAAESHAFKETLGSAAQPSFVKSTGLAVDQASGDPLVIDETAGTVSRFKANGEPEPFSALGTNVIDGKVGADKTPQEGLSFIDPRVEQIAIDESAGPGKGNIYVTQYTTKLVDVFAPTGAYLGQLSEFKQGLAAEGALKGFGEICGVAVDSSGAVYVGDLGRGEVHKFSPAASPVVNADNKANFALAHVCMLAAGAGPTAGFLFAGELDIFGGKGHILKLDAGTGAQKYVVSEGEYLTLSVDLGSGHVYGVPKEGLVKDFDATGASSATLLDSFGGTVDVVLGVAVNGTTGDVYLARFKNPHIEVWETISLPEAFTEAVTGVGPEEATLHGKVSAAGGPSTSCKFEYTTEAKFKKEEFTGAKSAACVPPGPFTGSSLESVSATIANLSPGTPYVFRVVAIGKGTNNGEALGFTTLGPTIAEEEAGNITASEAQITGSVNPNGKATSFAVEYVSAAAFEESEYATATSIPVPARAIGSGSAPVAISQQLSSLAEATDYHFRLVATNPDATSHGEDKTFTTFAQPPSGLPDGRAFELVSPPLKLGEVTPPEPEGELGASCTECLPGVNNPTMPMQARPDGGAIAFEGQAFSGGTAVGANEYQAARGAGGWASADLSGAQFAADGGFRAFSSDLSRGVLAQSEPALSPQAPVGPEGRAFSNLYLWEGGALAPLVTSEPPSRSPGGGGGASFLPVFAGANAGTGAAAPFSHVIFEANDALIVEEPGLAPAAPKVGPSTCKAIAAECDLYEWVGGELRLVNVLPGNAAAVAGVIGAGHMLAPLPGFEAPDTDNAISADGRRIFWSDNSGQLYVRIDGEETREIEDGGRFLTAAADGSRVLLNDGCLYSVQAEGCEAQIGGPSTFQGILGASEDLSRVYFVDKAALTGSEENGNEETAMVGAFNLYAWSEAGGTSFIGRLLEEDNASSGTNGSMGTWKATPGNRTAQVSADGEYLAFMSGAALTGYDNTVAGGKKCGKGGSAAACPETFEYAAGARELVCASCDPSGERPLGRSNLSLIRKANATAPFPQPHNLTDNGEGRIFFESQDALSPKDTNGHIQDVYEWEPNGVGTCAKAGGCVFLISSGHSLNDSMFVDATPSGDDAFFITRERLVPSDQDDFLDLYDARVGSGIEVPETAPCEGEGCKGPVTEAPAQPSAGSSSFVGPGNQKPAKAKQKAQKKKHHKKKHKRHQRRRAGHHRVGGAK
jgi:hypothetical protein